MARFTGFPDGATGFFAELAADNRREWWLANKDRFDTTVRDPMRTMLDELEPAWGTLVAFRMNRDTRFSADKSPYKTAHAAMGETDGGSAHYVQLSAEGLFVGAGMYHLARDQLGRFRDAVGDDRRGAALLAAVDRVRQAGLEVTGGVAADRGAQGLAPRPPTHRAAAVDRLHRQPGVRRAGVAAAPPGHRGRPGLEAGRAGRGLARRPRRAERAAAPLNASLTPSSAATAGARRSACGPAAATRAAARRAASSTNGSAPRARPSAASSRQPSSDATTASRSTTSASRSTSPSPPASASQARPRTS